MLKKGVAAAEMVKARALGKYHHHSPSAGSSPITSPATNTNNSSRLLTPVISPNTKQRPGSKEGKGIDEVTDTSTMEDDLLMETIPSIVYEEGFFAT